jgi:hypothetical protein
VGKGSEESSGMDNVRAIESHLLTVLVCGQLLFEKLSVQLAVNVLVIQYIRLHKLSFDDSL